MVYAANFFSVQFRPYSGSRSSRYEKVNPAPHFVEATSYRERATLTEKIKNIIYIGCKAEKERSPK